MLTLVVFERALRFHATQHIAPPGHAAEGQTYVYRESRPVSSDLYKHSLGPLPANVVDDHAAVLDPPKYGDGLVVAPALQAQAVDGHDLVTWRGKIAASLPQQ